LHYVTVLAIEYREILQTEHRELPDAKHEKSSKVLGTAWHSGAARGGPSKFYPKNLRKSDCRNSDRKGE
jgi:hypothetical protein